MFLSQVWYCFMCLMPSSGAIFLLCSILLSNVTSIWCTLNYLTVIVYIYPRTKVSVFPFITLRSFRLFFWFYLSSFSFSISIVFPLSPSIFLFFLLCSILKRNYRWNQHINSPTTLHPTIYPHQNKNPPLLSATNSHPLFSLLTLDPWTLELLNSCHRSTLAQTEWTIWGASLSLPKYPSCRQWRN